MLTLYMRPTCHHCQAVEAVAQELGIALDEKDIADAAHAAELIERGGKQQVPYLVDTAHGVEMYESEDIITYLRSLAPSSPRG
jgi:glutaredoxin